MFWQINFIYSFQKGLTVRVAREILFKLHFFHPKIQTSIVSLIIYHFNQTAGYSDSSAAASGEGTLGLEFSVKCHQGNEKFINYSSDLCRKQKVDVYGKLIQI